MYYLPGYASLNVSSTALLSCGSSPFTHTVDQIDYALSQSAFLLKQLKRKWHHALIS